MAGKIKVSEIGNYCNAQMEKLLRETVLETDLLVKYKSPVHTGRFRESWQVGENAAPGGIAPKGSYSSVSSISRIGYSQEKIGNVYSVHNNLPYAERLATASTQSGRAWSNQAPPGWVQGIAKDVQGRVQSAAARIGRES